MAEPKRMTIDEFRRLGYMSEVNRRLLHPLGLALEARQEGTDGPWVIASVWDYRDDPEGIAYQGIMDPDEARTRAERIDREWAAKEQTRPAILGYMVQPPDDPAMFTPKGS